MKIIAALCVLLLASTLQAQQSSIPEIPFDAVAIVTNLKMPPGLYLGEAAGVDIDSKGNIYVYSRTGGVGDIYTRRSAQLFEFDSTGKFIREIAGNNNYVMGWAHSVRIDKDDNIWIVDNGTNLVGKFNQQGQMLMALGRRNESVGGKIEPNTPMGLLSMNHPGLFFEPTDVAFDAEGNVFVSDGYVNSLVQKFDKDGNLVTVWGKKGSGEGELNLPHGIATDEQGNVYVADRSNNRVQVFDNNGKFLRMWETKNEFRVSKDAFPPVPGLMVRPDGFYGSLLPNSICITRGPDPILYANDVMPGEGGALYAYTLDGKPIGHLGHSGKKVGQFGWMHELACGKARNEVYVTEMVNYRVQKLTLHLDRIGK
jgi:DNA-binding beta-propeller fold protein YncE